MRTAQPGDPALVPESLPTALLLAGTAGVLDAATYLLHGRVFATAMTGNTVLLGISAFSGNWYEFLRHAVPIAAFVAGVAVSKATRVALGARATMLALVIEAGTLVVAGFLPASFPEALFTGGVSFVCALQVTGLRHVGPYVYNSTFVTGDLLEFVEALLDWRSRGSVARVGRRAALKARDLGLVWTAFVLGAVLGALATPRLGNHAFWLPVPVLAVVMALVLRDAGTAGQPLV